MLFFPLLCGTCLLSKRFHPSVNATITDNGHWVRYRLCYPAFNWTVPRGMNKRATELFWKQPENWRHFRDTNASDHCGVVRVIKNGIVRQPFPESISNVTHFINDEGPPKTTRYPSQEFRAILTGHWGNYFQHFFDNLGPQIVMLLEALGMEPQDVPVYINVTSNFKNVPYLWDRLGFRKWLCYVRPTDVSAETLALVESAPRVHPHFFARLREMLDIPRRVPRKIVWISRRMDNSYFRTRFVLNELEVVSALRKRFGSNNVVVFDHTQSSFQDTIDLFAQAKCIIGSHGGGMYNQFMAPKEAVIVEIMPVQSNGLYHDQQSFMEVPQFSHMAVWSNSLLIGQPFWRYYQISQTASYNLNVNDFLAFLRQIPELTEEDEL